MSWVWVVATLAVCASSFLGALVSKGVNTGLLPWYSPIGTAILAGTAWGWIVKQRVTLVHVSIFYDVVVNLVYISTFVWLGDRLTFTQMCGAALSITGVILMSMK